MRARGGFTLVELAVAALLLGVVALAATMLFVPATRMWWQAQAALEQQGDLLEVRHRLEEDVHDAVSARVVQERLQLRRSDGRWACYRFAAGRLERGESRRSCRGALYRPLTLSEGYRGAFEVVGSGVRLRFLGTPDGQGSPEVYVATRVRSSLR